MIYRTDKQGNKISQLGYGCMRFTKKGNSIDFEKAQQEILRGIELGINYYDTAFVYPGSEECLGQILANNNKRTDVFIATKLPQYIMKTMAQIEKTFAEELARLQTDYIDYYLMHMFTDISEWEHLKALGIEEWIAAKKEQGAIRNIGFSYHGNTEIFLQLLDVYDWDFCQIQYNYLDETSQAGRDGLNAAYEKGIPVIIMEPLRGGKLVEIPEAAKRLLQEDENHYTPAELGLSWLWNQPGVTCVLSGMNSIEMLEENVRIASSRESNSFTDKDFELVNRVKAIIKEKEKVGCTACRYCMPCPMGVDIPGNFYYYNLMYTESKKTGRFGFAQTMGMRADPVYASQCIQCGKCEKHCPQHIAIREKLKEADAALRPLPYRIGIAVARRIMVKKK